MNIVHKNEGAIMPKTLSNVKEDIMQTTRDMIIESGYSGLNIRDIAARCGIATGTFYNYFGSKQEIVSAILASDWDKMERFIQRRLISELDMYSQLEEVFNGLKQMMYSVHKIWSEGFPSDLESGTMNRLQAVKQKLRNDFSQTIRQIISGKVPEKDEAFTADFIARMFFSYAYDNDSDFKQLRAAIEKLFS
jgi:AcrR family transcriptional regulator